MLLPGAEGVAGLFAMVWMGGWWGGIIAVGWASLKGMLGARGIWRKISSLFGLVFLIPFIGAGVIAPAMILFQGGFRPRSRCWWERAWCSASST